MNPLATLASVPTWIAMIASASLALVIVRAIFARPSVGMNLLGIVSMLALALTIYARGAA